MSGEHTPGECRCDECRAALAADPVREAAHDLLAALEGIIPSNVALPVWLDDSAVIPVDVTVAELRRARTAIQKARGQ